MIPTSFHRRGFTLIEMSIVLVIVALIIGGILVGREMIQQSILKSQITQIEQFKTAMNTFRLKYNCKAGDCLNATTFFGSAGASCSSNGTITTPQTATCDGNGDGIIIYDGATPTAQQARTREIGLFWQHLANAGMIEGAYTGDIGYGGTGYPLSSTPGLSTPYLRYSKTGVISYFCWTATLFPSPVSCPERVPAVSAWANAHAFFIGTPRAPYLVPIDPLFSAPDAMTIDSKIDDGTPINGRVRADGTNCITFSAPSTYGWGQGTQPACFMLWTHKP